MTVAELRKTLEQCAPGAIVQAQGNDIVKVKSDGETVEIMLGWDHEERETNP
jgi:hypothetical protein